MTISTAPFRNPEEDSLQRLVVAWSAVPWWSGPQVSGGRGATENRTPVHNRQETDADPRGRHNGAHVILGTAVGGVEARRLV
jgi:hypothetical protein